MFNGEASGGLIVRLLSRFRGLLGTRPRPRLVIEEPRQLTLRDVWFLDQIPFQDLDAELVDNPPFADISGVRSVILDIVKQAYDKGSQRILVVGERGSGKSTFAKSVISLLRVFGKDVAALYLTTRFAYSFEDFLYKLGIELGRELARVAENNNAIAQAEVKEVESSFRRIENLLTDLARRARCVMIVIDNLDRLFELNYDAASRFLKLLESYVASYNNFSVLFTMDYAAYLKYINDAEIGVILRDYRVVNLKDFRVRTADDLARLIYAHISRYRAEPDAVARPEVMQRVLSRNPIHPFTRDAVHELYSIMGVRTPREYVLILHDLCKQAAEARAPRIDAVVVTNYFKLTPAEEVIAKRSLTQGIFIGGFIGMGAFMLAYGLVAGRFEVAAYGAILATIGAMMYFTQQRRYT